MNGVYINHTHIKAERFIYKQRNNYRYVRSDDTYEKLFDIGHKKCSYAGFLFFPSIAE